MTEDFYKSFKDSIETVMCDIKENSPLIHCITNPISINDCANVILGLGASPIMAEHPKEVSEITRLSSALCLNIGNITDARMSSIMISGQTAYENNIPSVLDIVGITCSTLRYDFITKFLEKVKPSVIKGNLSEIKKLAQSRASYIGIDSTEKLDTENDLMEAVSIVKDLAAHTGCTIVASGMTDIISDGNLAACIYNGSPAMSRITGTGCILNVVIGTMLASQYSNTMEKSVLATAILGICGEIGYSLSINDKSPLQLGTYHMNLLNALSTVSPYDIKERVKIKII